MEFTQSIIFLTQIYLSFLFKFKIRREKIYYMGQQKKNRI